MNEKLESAEQDFIVTNFESDSDVSEEDFTESDEESV